MKNFKFKIKAVRLGAIGKKQTFYPTIKANNEEEAILKLYDNFEHIFIEKINNETYSYI